MPMQEEILEAVGEVKREIVKQGMILEQVLKQATITNGRVGKLEDWQKTVQLTDAHNRGVLEGTATTALTRGQLRALLVAVTGITTVSGTIVGIIVKVAG